MDRGLPEIRPSRVTRPGETGRASPGTPGVDVTFSRRVPAMNDNDHNNNRAN
jgi:hypothetical protein